MKKKVLVIDCCIRKEKSATAKLLASYLEKHCAQCTIEKLKLYEMDLRPMLLEDLENRDSLLLASKYDDPYFSLARQFRDADLVVFAAPFWDMSFPSLLKVYVEHICASGITFSSSAEGGLQGLCKAEKFVYISTCGGYQKGENEGARYIRALGKNLLGVKETEEFIIDGLDVDPTQRENRLQTEIRRLMA